MIVIRILITIPIIFGVAVTLFAWLLIWAEKDEIIAKIVELKIEREAELERLDKAQKQK